MRRSLLVLLIAVLAVMLSACTQVTFVNWDDIFPDGGVAKKLSADELIEHLDIPGLIEIAAGSGKAPEGVSITDHGESASATASRAGTALAVKDISFDGYAPEGIEVVSGLLTVSFYGSGTAVDSFSFTIASDLEITSSDGRYSYTVGTDDAVKGTITAAVDNEGNLTGGKGAFIAFGSSLLVDNREVQADGSEGDGSIRNPYVFTTASQLFSFAEAYNSGDIAPEHEYIYAELDADMDLEGAQWIPIGKTTRSGSGFLDGDRAFRGSFNGSGHTISGFSFADDAAAENEGIGLFSAIAGENTIVRGVRIQGTIESSANGSAGFIAGILADKAVIDGCIVLKGSSIEAKEAGGIVGRMLMSGTVSNSENNASVIALGGKAGGIANAAYYDQFAAADSNRADYAAFSISGCINNGDITGKGYTGGIAGLAGGAVLIEDCENIGDVRGDGTSVGGIVGELIHGASIDSCVNSGDVSNGGSATGGIAGWIRYNNPSSYNTSLVCSVSSSHNTGDVSSDGYGAGGAIGLIYWAGDISGCSSGGTVTAGVGNMVGGFCGGVQYLSVNDDDDSTEGPSSATPDANYSASRDNGISFTDCHSDNADVIVTGAGSVVGDFIGHGVDCGIEGLTDIVTAFTDCTPAGEGSGIR